jgi:hypothetical protein
MPLRLSAPNLMTLVVHALKNTHKEHVFKYLAVAREPILSSLGVC